MGQHSSQRQQHAEAQSTLRQLLAAHGSSPAHLRRRQRHRLKFLISRTTAPSAAAAAAAAALAAGVAAAAAERSRTACLAGCCSLCSCRRLLCQCRCAQQALLLCVFCYKPLHPGRKCGGRQPWCAGQGMVVGVGRCRELQLLVAPRACGIAQHVGCATGQRNRRGGNAGSGLADICNILHCSRASTRSQQPGAAVRSPAVHSCSSLLICSL